MPQSIRRPRLPSRIASVPALLLGVACLHPTAAPVRAQTPGREPAVAELHPGARTLGLGMAPQLDGGTPDLAVTHPALVTRAGGVSAGHTWFGGSAAAFYLAAAGDGMGGGFAVSLSTLEYRTEAPAPGSRGLGLDDFVSDAPAGSAVFESAATVTYGRSLFGIDVGASGRFYTQRYGDARSTGYAFDVGVARGVGPVRLALSGRNVGSDELLPTEVVLGAGAYGRPVGPLDLGFAAQLVRRDDGEVIAGGGMEFGYWPIRGRTFVGRVGFRNVPDGEASPVTLGGSFWADSLVLDYAYQPMGGLDGIHRIGLGWR